jgi:hypothetical protein
MSIYVPIRDAMYSAFKKGGVYNDKHKQDESTPLYVVDSVIDDIRDIFTWRDNTTPEQVKAAFEDMSKEFRPPSDDFYIELPKTAHGPFAIDAEVGVAKVKPDHGFEWEYELTAKFRGSSRITILDAYAQINNGRVQVRKSKDNPRVTVNLNTLKSTFGSTPEMQAWETMWQAARLTLGFCKLLGVKNAVVSERTYTPAEQKEWRRHTSPKKMPRYRILTINRPTFLTDSNDHDSEGGEHDPEKRRHHVRGHFRTYRHERYRPEQRGTYWIRPHWRGSEALGVIDTPVHVRNHSARN